MNGRIERIPAYATSTTLEASLKGFSFLLLVKTRPVAPDLAKGNIWRQAERH
jgi:hypothetical protein